MSLNEFLARLHLPVQHRMPGFEGANAWLNSEPLTPDALKGKVVAVDFWTYTCINWLRTLASLRAWHQTYADKGLVIVGVHTPEFGIEHDLDNVRWNVEALGVEYPVAVDNDYAVWNAFANRYWPALYITDADGRIRHHRFGEGEYDKAERVIRQLLDDAGATDLPDKPAATDPHGLEVEADWHDLRSPESYLGLARGQGFVSPGRPAVDEPLDYTLPDRMYVNQWGLVGNWTLGYEEVTCNEAGGRIAYRFHARDAHLILTPPEHGSARFRVTLDGEAPDDAHGVDIDEAGNGVAAHSRLYQLIRQPGRITDRQFEIEFLDPGAAALCFTFG